MRLLYSLVFFVLALSAFTQPRYWLPTRLHDPQEYSSAGTDVWVAKHAIYNWSVARVSGYYKETRESLSTPCVWMSLLAQWYRQALPTGEYRTGVAKAIWDEGSTDDDKWVAGGYVGPEGAALAAVWLQGNLRVIHPDDGSVRSVVEEVNRDYYAGWREVDEGMGPVRKATVWKKSGNKIIWHDFHPQGATSTANGVWNVSPDNDSTLVVVGQVDGHATRWVGLPARLVQDVHPSIAASSSTLTGVHDGGAYGEEASGSALFEVLRPLHWYNFSPLRWHDIGTNPYLSGEALGIFEGWSVGYRSDKLMLATAWQVGGGYVSQVVDLHQNLINEYPDYLFSKANDDWAVEVTGVAAGEAYILDPIDEIFVPHAIFWGPDIFDTGKGG